MGNRADNRRRWIGAAFLGAAVAMLIAGETVLRGRLGGLGLLLFYLVCTVLVCLAILVALLDLAVVRHRAREEQRALLEDTLKNIARQEEAGAVGPPSDGDSR